MGLRCGKGLLGDMGNDLVMEINDAGVTEGRRGVREGDS